MFRITYLAVLPSVDTAGLWTLWGYASALVGEEASREIEMSQAQIILLN
jgi:hypothetical protein